MLGLRLCQAKVYPLDFNSTSFDIKILRDLFAFKRELNSKGYVLWVKRNPYQFFNSRAGGTSIQYTVKE